MKTASLVLLMALRACSQTPCVLTPCSFSTNVEWTTAGHADPNFWGTLDSVTTAIPFSSVPKNYRVQLLHVSGDQIAAPAPNGKSVPGGTVYAGPYVPCVPAANSISYVLFSLTNTSPVVQQFSPLEQGAGFIFHQLQVPYMGSRAAFDNDVVPGAYLNADNVLNANQAMFLNTTGCPTHMELSLVLTFRFVPNPPVVAPVAPKKSVFYQCCGNAGFESGRYLDVSSGKEMCWGKNEWHVCKVQISQLTKGNTK